MCPGGSATLATPDIHSEIYEEGYTPALPFFIGWCRALPSDSNQWINWEVERGTLAHVIQSYLRGHRNPTNYQAFRRNWYRSNKVLLHLPFHSMALHDGLGKWHWHRYHHLKKGMHIELWKCQWCHMATVYMVAHHRALWISQVPGFEPQIFERFVAQYFMDNWQYHSFTSNYQVIRNKRHQITESRLYIYFFICRCYTWYKMVWKQNMCISNARALPKLQNTLKSLAIF